MKRTYTILVFWGFGVIASLTFLAWSFIEGKEERVASKSLATEHYKILKNGGVVVFSIEELHPKPFELDRIYQQGPEMADMQILVRLRKPEQE